MLASFQRRILFALACVILVWLAIFVWLGSPWWGLAGSPIAVLAYCSVLALEFVAMVRLQDQKMPDLARVRAVVRAWWGEVSTAPAVFCWQQPFRAAAEPDELPEVAGTRGVVLVHGFVCNRGFWNPWMHVLRRQGTPFVAVNLEPLFASIDAYADTIDAAVRRMEAATGLPVVLVGHSMGGLAIRAWLRRFEADARVHRVVTIGTPHRGTWLARTGRTVNGRQMRIGSDWLRELAVAEPPHRAERFSCCYSDCDNIVFPAQTASLPGASNLLIPGAAHVQLAFLPAVFAEVGRWLEPGNRSAVSVSAAH